MQTELNYENIVALLKAAKQAAKPERERAKSVKPWQAERSGQFRADQASVVTDVQDNLAKALTQSLGAYLRVSFETTSVSVTQITFREAVGHTTEGTYNLALKFQGTPAVIQLEQTLVFPLIDILLGGTGQGPATPRDVTEIETHVMEGIGRIICHEIATAWGLDSSDCELIGPQGLAQMQRLLSANDRVVVSQFESKMGEATGFLRLLVPGTAFNALLRKLSTDGQTKSPRASAASTKLGEKMLECTFRVSLGVAAIKLPVDRVLKLAPGQVCDLGVPVNQPAALIIAGRDTFDANPVRQGRKRAAHLGQPRLQPIEERTT
ncbi:MAG TPA: FliM/FliN family flagellar motor switch protein [Terriglobales bacterium]|nr:FliM/FliN family flagellar motor switch protein [Terriglobales bacterium]